VAQRGLNGRRWCGHLNQYAWGMTFDRDRAFGASASLAGARMTELYVESCTTTDSGAQRAGRLLIGITLGA